MEAHAAPLLDSGVPPESPERGQRAQVARLRAHLGRPPLLPTPDVEPTSLWAEALEGYELYLMARGHSLNLQRNRFYSVRAMARHATKAGYEPGDLDQAGLQRYLLKQYQDRKGTGREALFQELKS